MMLRTSVMICLVVLCPLLNCDASDDADGTYLLDGLSAPAASTRPVHVPHPKPGGTATIMTPPEYGPGAELPSEKENVYEVSVDEDEQEDPYGPSSSTPSVKMTSTSSSTPSPTGTRTEKSKPSLSSGGSGTERASSSSSTSASSAGKFFRGLFRFAVVRMIWGTVGGWLLCADLCIELFDFMGIWDAETLRGPKPLFSKLQRISEQLAVERTSVTRSNANRTRTLIDSDGGVREPGRVNAHEYGDALGFGDFDQIGDTLADTIRDVMQELDQAFAHNATVNELEHEQEQPTTQLPQQTQGEGRSVDAQQVIEVKVGGGDSLGERQADYDYDFDYRGKPRTHRKGNKKSFSSRRLNAFHDVITDAIERFFFGGKLGLYQVLAQVFNLPSAEVTGLLYDLGEVLAAVSDMTGIPVGETRTRFTGKEGGGFDVDETDAFDHGAFLFDETEDEGRRRRILLSEDDDTARARRARAMGSIQSRREKRHRVVHLMLHYMFVLSCMFVVSFFLGFVMRSGPRDRPCWSMLFLAF